MGISLNSKRVVLVLLGSLAMLAANAYSKSLELQSPNGDLSLQFIVDDQGARYQVDYQGEPLLSPSELGFQFSEDSGFSGSLALAAHEYHSSDSTWEQTWGESHFVRDHYNELRASLEVGESSGDRLQLYFRAYDDGIAFRYTILSDSPGKTFTILDELSEFAFASDNTTWWTPAFEDARFEYLYQVNPLSELDSVHTPLTMKTGSGVHLSVHEAGLTDYATMTLKRKESLRFEADLVPWSDGSKVKGKTPFETPWRVLIVSDNAAGLIESNLVLNLNKPNQIEDTSWVKPAKYVGIWWEMHRFLSTWGSGPAHGANNKNMKRHIDFAAEHGFQGVLVEGWNKGWDGNWIENRDQFSYTETYDDFDILALNTYARKRGVKLILQTEAAGGIPNYESQMEGAYEFYGELDVLGLKTGNVAGGQNVDRIDANGNTVKEWSHGQYMVQHFHRVAQEAAKNQLLIFSHEGVKDAGIRRTYPNMMARENARGQEYNAWSGDGGNPPNHTAILPFTRMLDGPMDFTPGIFDLTYQLSSKEARRTESLFENEAPSFFDRLLSFLGLSPSNDMPEVDGLENRVNTTLAKQLSLYVVLYSPIQMAADLLDAYEGHPAFQFIVDVPVDWEQSRVINAEIGEFITIARQERTADGAGTDWYLGSLTNEQPRSFEVALDFLDPGVTYQAEIYADGPGADWKSNPYSYGMTTQHVSSTDSLKIDLAPGGGQAIRFKALDNEVSP